MGHGDIARRRIRSNRHGQDCMQRIGGRGERKRGGGGRREMIVITDAQKSFLFTKCT